MATISEAEILKAAAEASLISSAGNLETISLPSSNGNLATVVFNASSLGNVMHTTPGPTAKSANENVGTDINQDLGGDTEYENVPTVSENAIIRTGFEVGGKTYDNVEAILAAHLMGVDDPGTSMKVDHCSNTDFDDPFQEMGDLVTYKIEKGGTKRGNDKLLDSLGFSYTLKNTKSNSCITYWWCTVRNSHCKCPAIVKQVGNTFTRGKWKHEHLVGLNKSTIHSTPRTKKKEIREKKKLKRKTKEENRAPDYVILKEGSKAGMDLLKDKFGYTYTMRKANKNSDKCNWICSIRNKHLRCPASVCQQGGTFKPGIYDHKHLPGEKTEKPAEVVSAYNEAFLRNSQGGVEDSEEDEEDDYYDDDDDDDEDEEDDFDYGDTASGTIVRTSKNRKKDRKEHPTFLGPTCTINLTKCDMPGCNCKLVHCPFCDKDHFKPAKPARVQDHLEMSHFAHGVQYDDYMIVKCFKDCGMKKFGHYHCVFCKEQIIKRTAYGRHLSRHMRRKGIPAHLLILPDAKFPDTINAYGYEIPICKNDCKTSEGKHFHCPKCDRVCRERSVTVNHVWRCLQAEKSPAEEEPVDLNEAEEYQLEESLLKDHFSIVKNFKDLNMKRCEEPSCCRNMYHCQLCPPNLYRPTYKQQLIVHYISHWKTRVPYKGFNILRCFHACLDPRLAPIKTRYHYHCPLCAKMLRQRNTFQDHLSYCHYFNTGESVTIDCTTDRAEDVAKITQELGPLIENVDYMEDKLTMEAKLNQALKVAASISPGVVQRPRRGSAVRKESDSEADESMDEDDSYEEKAPLTSTPAVHSEFLRHLTAEKSGLVFEDITDVAEEVVEEEDRRSFKEKFNAYDMDLSMIFETASAVLSENLLKAFRKESSLKACLSIVTKRTATKLLYTETGGKKTYMLTGKLDNLSLAQQLIAQLILPTDRADAMTTSFSKHSQRLKERATLIKKEIQDSYEDEENKTEEYDKRTRRKRPETYNEKMARIKKEKETNKKKSDAGKSKTPAAEEKKKGKSKGRKDTAETEDMNDSFPYSEIKEIIAASKKVDQKGSTSRGRKGKVKEKEKVVITAPVRTSSRGRPLTQKQETPTSKAKVSKSRTESPSVRTPKVSMKKNKKDSSKTPSRYSTRGIKVDYQKMNAGQVYIKEEVISDEEDSSRIVVAIENAESESEEDTKPQRKRSTPAKGEKKTPKRSTVMYKPMTDSEISDNEEVDEADSQEADDSLSDMDYEEENDTGEAVKTSASELEQTEMEDKQELESRESDNDDKVNESEPKVTVEKVATGSPVKLGTSSPVKKVPEIIAKKIIPVSPRKVSTDNSKLISKEGQSAGYKDAKIVASVPTIFNAGARKMSIISRKRPADGSVGSERIKRQRSDGNENDSLEVNERVDNVLEGDWAETGLGMLAKNKLKCSLCNFEAEIFSGLTEHLIGFHNVAEPPRCDICELDFAAAKQLHLHLDRKHGPQPEPAKFKCGACDSIFSSQLLCQSHISRVHLKKDRTGEQQNKGARHSCQKCEFSSTAAQDYHDHMKIEHGEDIVCNSCDKTFSNVHNLKMHEETIHLKNKTAACYVCGKHFNHIRYLKTHMELHSDTHKFSCDQCERRFSAKASLIAHLETHKPVDERDYKFVCSYCGKRYLLKSNYEDHLNKHTGAKPYTCKLCNRRFGFRSMLMKHNIYIHSTDRPYSCSQCHKAFKFQRLLDNHMTTHTMLSKHVCSKCFKSFSTKSSLKVHEQKCTGVLTKQHVPTVGKGNTLILYTDGRPNMYQLSVGNEQFVTTNTNDGVNTLVSIPDQPTVQEQILTEVLTEPTTEVLPQPMTDELVPQMTDEQLQINQTVEAGAEVAVENAETFMDQNLSAVSEQGGDLQAASGQGDARGEVYVCSECNSLFSSFAEAESHILNAHSQQVVS